MTAPGHDWSARARSTAMDALRYTRFVGVMKRALPAAAFVIIATVAAFFFLQRQPERTQMSYARLGHIQNDLTMVKPRLSGTDSKGNPFVITADAAIQDVKHPKLARLTNVEADLTLDKKSWITVTAKRGLVDTNAGSLTLGGGIAVFSDSGYELHTASAQVDLGEGVVTGPAITGHGPMGALRADRFRMDRSTGQISLEGHVHMTILPPDRKKS
jgi:lipopolysaccharide export system protein LptC